MLQKVSRNVFSNWAALAINLVISFFLAPFVVNRLGSLYYGIWVIMMQLTGYIYLLDFGVRESVIRFVSKHNAKRDLSQLELVINAALRIYGVISLICIGLGVGLAAAFPLVFNVSPEAVPTAQHVVMITAVNMAQFFIFNVYVGVLMGIQRFDVFNKISIVFTFIRVGLIVLFLSQGYGILALAYIQLFINFGSNLLVYLKARIHVPVRIRLRIAPTAFKQVVKSLVNYSFFVLLNNICQKIIFYTDALVIGIFLPASAITYYAIAGNLIEYLRKFVISMASVFNPLTSELDARNELAKIQNLLILGSKISLLLGLPICIIYFIMGSRFIGIWMGPEFAAPAGEVLMILAITHLFSLPHHSISSIFYGLSRHHIIAYLRVFEAIANLAISLLLVKRYGIVGIALGTAIPHIISVVFVLPVLVVKSLGLKLSNYVREVYLGPIAASMPYVVLCYLVETKLQTETLAGFFGLIFALLPFYLVPAWMISFNKEERQWHRSLVYPLLGIKKP